MTTEQHFTQGFVRSGTATADINEFRAIKHATTGTEDLKFTQAGAGEEPAGISVQAVVAGQSIGICTLGFGMCRVNGASPAIAAGDKLKSGANGILVKAVAGDIYIAEAWEPATADGLEIRVFILKGRLPA